MSGQSRGPLSSVGAILFFFGFEPVSSFSLSLSSLLEPATLPAVLRGVSGGVVIGTPVTLPECVAVSPGTFPARSGGAVAEGTTDACVMTEEVELDLAGDDGRWLTNEAASDGDGAVNELLDSRCRWPLWKGDGGANCEVDVGIGVFCVDDAVMSAAS